MERGNSARPQMVDGTKLRPVAAIGVPGAVLTTLLYLIGALGAAVAINSLRTDFTPGNIEYVIGNLLGGALSGGISGRPLAEMLTNAANQPAQGPLCFLRPSPNGDLIAEAGARTNQGVDPAVLPQHMQTAEREGAIHQFGSARNATTTYTRMDATHLKSRRCE